MECSSSLLTEIDPLRPANDVMRLVVMGAAYPTRLSFMRVLLRRLSREKSVVERILWELDDQGFGRAVYRVDLGGYDYSLIAFTNTLAAHQRTDRVIAEAWDASFVLFDGTPSNEDLDRLEKNVPLQEAGRFRSSELILSRANKSVRLFEHTVDQLAHGRQPDNEMICKIGYLMRTTAVYGNGKFGIADRAKIANRPAMGGPFQAEMLCVWLIRGVTHDLAAHIAYHRNPQKAISLAPHIKRNLGIGNSTGLGMAPFLVNHNRLLSNWMMAREKAIARVRAIGYADQRAIEIHYQLLSRAQRHVGQWQVENEFQQRKINVLMDELEQLSLRTDRITPSFEKPWNRLLNDVSDNSYECRELIAALILEPYGELIDVLFDEMADNDGIEVDPAMELHELRELLEENYAWALKIDFNDNDEAHFFWYISEEKLEPRFGERGRDEGDEKELPLDIARQAQRLYANLTDELADGNVALFLVKFPQHRDIIRRIQLSKFCCYSEIQENLIGATCMPLDILRFKLSFFGACKCDPKSNLWTRITMYQGAPLFDELNAASADDWWLPIFEEA